MSFVDRTLGENTFDAKVWLDKCYALFIAGKSTNRFTEFKRGLSYKHVIPDNIKWMHGYWQ